MIKKIIHLSDLHFGTEIPSVLTSLVETLNHLNPDLIIVSGDLTQRALTSQFHRAANFLKQLNAKHILCVPGNHDISLHNVFERFLYPFRQYQKFINNELFPVYNDDNVAVLGINSVTPYKHMSGFVTTQQLDYVNNFFAQYDPKIIRILVMHHNLVHSERHKIINDAEKIITLFSQCNINLILSGHIHYAYIEQLKRNYFSHNMYVITAGTPISTRTIEPNSFNIIELEHSHFTLSVSEYIENKFIITRAEQFQL